MTLIYCPECKKHDIGQGGGLPALRVKRTYFAPRQEQAAAVMVKNEATSGSDYKTIRNMLIAFKRDYRFGNSQ